jgi:hypothetical protein
LGWRGRKNHQLEVGIFRFSGQLQVAILGFQGVGGRNRAGGAALCRGKKAVNGNGGRGIHPIKNPFFSSIIEEKKGKRVTKG